MAEDDNDFDRSIGSIKNLLFTALADHEREKKTLRAPFHKLRDRMAFSSWKDDALPLYSWAVLCVGLWPRDRYLAAFRDIVSRVKDRHDENADEFYLSHIALKEVPNEQFDYLFEVLLLDPELRAQLSVLSTIDSLPDHQHWQRHAEGMKQQVDLTALAEGYAKCFDHQSQQATDIRWLILMNFMANGRLHVAAGPLEEQFREILEYPDRGDMRQVRPSIRAMEIGLRGDPFERDMKKKDEKYRDVAEAVWQQLYSGTPCLPLTHPRAVPFDHTKVRAEVVTLYNEVGHYFHETITSTGVDPRHDSAFGLVLYALALLFEGTGFRLTQRVSAKLVLRTILEAYINLHFLRSKDDPTIWFQFRNYGSSQTKLAFLKYMDVKHKPDYVNMEELYQFANEDIWQEFQDINLGNWAKKSLREIALDAGVKDAYDQHYAILSTAIHAQWTGVRESNFVQCVNPLHRFHRIPGPPRLGKENLVPDMCKFVNQMLDDLNALYPTFKPRLRAYKSSYEPIPDEAQPQDSTPTKNREE